MGYAYDESPFAPLRTTVPTPDMKDAEIAKLRAEVDSLRSDRDDVIRRNAQLAGDTVPLDEAIAHLASYCHARGYAEDCAAMQQPGSRSKFAATLWRVLGNAHADRRFLLSELDAARAALDAYQSPEAAHALALRVIEQSQRAFRAEAALDGERQTADTFREAIRLLLARCDDDPDEAAHTPPHIRQAIMAYDQRRAAPRAAGGG